MMISRSTEIIAALRGRLPYRNADLYASYIKIFVLSFGPPFVANCIGANSKTLEDVFAMHTNNSTRFIIGIVILNKVSQNPAPSIFAAS